MLRVGQRDGQEFSYIYILNIYEYIEAANALTLRDWHDIVILAFRACDEENRYGGAMPMEGGRIILLGRSGENADC